MEKIPFSVAMCVYKGDKAEWFDEAIASVINQTVVPDEIVLVVDGPVSESIDAVISKYENLSGQSGIKFKAVRQPINQGLGISLRIAVEACGNELIARMDSDDIAVSNRFEQQIKYFSEHPETDILGGDIAEFIDDQAAVVGYRRVPVEDAVIKRYAQKRCPFNHMTVMYKKTSVIKAGGYVDWFWNEDYYLWMRMIKNGGVLANTGIVLVKSRVDENWYQRRGSIKYFKSEAKLQKYMYDNKMISTTTFICNLTKRFIVQVLLPNKIRSFVFKKFAREK